MTLLNELKKESLFQAQAGTWPGSVEETLVVGNRAVLLDAGRQKVMLGEEEKEMFIVDCEQEENVEALLKSSCSRKMFSVTWGSDKRLRRICFDCC